MHDIRYALRMLLKNPVFTVVAAVSLALGIGANTALFSVVDGVLIHPYPYGRPGEIWWPSAIGKKADENRRGYRLGEFLDLAKLPVFSEAMATSPGQMLLTGEFSPENFRVVRLTAGAFHFLQVQPLAGRWFGPGDLRANGEAEPVLVLSYQAWNRLFQGSPEAMGKKLRLDDKDYTVIGVMPPRFGWWTADGAWTPLAEDRRDTRTAYPLVRLKPGVTPAAAEQQLQLLHEEMARANPGEFFKDGFTSKLTNYLDLTVASGDMKTSLLLLFGAVILLLLIACANVANLQMARATSRTREMAIRLSVGAGRGRLIRQLLTESLALSLLGGVLGLFFAYWLTNLMVAMMPGSLVPNESRVEINGSVLFFCVVTSMLSGVLFGLVPALRATRPDLTDSLKDGARGAGSAERGGRTYGWLVVAEVALAVVLLLSGAMTTRSFNALQNVDLGFRPDRLVVVDVPLDRKRYGTYAKRNRFCQDLLERVSRLPDVEGAAIGNGGLPFGGPDSEYAIEGRPVEGTRQMNLCLMSEDYIKTLGIPLRRGRMPTGREIDDAAPVAVVNEAAAALWGAGEDPIGRRLRLNLLTNANEGLLAAPGGGAFVTIVGVIGNTRTDGLSGELTASAFVPFTLLAPPQRTLAVRAKGDERRVLKLVRDEAARLDPQQPLGRGFTIEELLGFQTGQPRFIMALFGLFASLGLVLAVAGIYSMLSYLVTRRSHEIGVRMALGARRQAVLGLVLKAGGRLVVVGLLIGLPAGFGAAQLLQSQLFKVPALDLWSYLGVVVVLGVTGTAACFIPARRATKVDPMVALRCE